MPAAPPAPELPELPELPPLRPAVPPLPELFAPELDEPELGATSATRARLGVEPLGRWRRRKKSSLRSSSRPSAVLGEPFDEQPSAKRLVPARIAA